jgi:hypothetical protein
LIFLHFVVILSLTTDKFICGKPARMGGEKQYKFKRRNCMKNILKILGIITCMVVIGFSMTSCEEDPGVGTVEVFIKSGPGMTFDTDGVKVELRQGSDIIGTQTKVMPSKTAIFEDVPEGDDYEVWVTDNEPRTYKSAKFSIAKDDTVKLTYDGLSVK